MEVIYHWRNWIRQGSSNKIKHSIIRRLIRGRRQENKGLWNQDKNSRSQYWARRSLHFVLLNWTHWQRNNILLPRPHKDPPCSTVIRSSALLFWSTIPTSEFIYLWSDSRLSVVGAMVWSSLSPKSPTRWYVYSGSSYSSSCNQRKGNPKSHEQRNENLFLWAVVEEERGFLFLKQVHMEV